MNTSCCSVDVDVPDVVSEIAARRMLSISLAEEGWEKIPESVEIDGQTFDLPLVRAAKAKMSKRGFS